MHAHTYEHTWTTRFLVKLSGWVGACLRMYVFAGFQHVNVSEVVKEKNLHSGKHEDQELDSETPIQTKP
jgi:hypothetical protein